MSFILSSMVFALGPFSPVAPNNHTKLEKYLKYSKFFDKIY